MKRFGLFVLALIGGSLAYCSIPFTQVATITIKVTDQAGGKIDKGARAVFRDEAGREIVTVRSGARGSWGHNLHWWTHSSHRQSLLRPADAKRARSVRVEAKNCQARVAPVLLKRTYQPLSFMPHGGGPAYLHYRFEGSVMLQCAQ